MTLPPRLRQLLLGLMCLIFLWLATEGIGGGINQLSQRPTIGQMIQSYLQVAYGLFALLCVVTVFSSPRLSRLVQIGWMITVSLAAGIAAVVWGDAPIWAGAAAGIASFLVAWGLSWLLRVGARTNKLAS